MEDAFHIALTAWGTVILALLTFISIIAFMFINKKSVGSDICFRLEDKFYHDERFRSLRHKAATELLRLEIEKEEISSKTPYFVDIANFFDFVGVLIKKNSVSSEMIWHSFYRRAFAYWHLAEKHGVIEKYRKIRWIGCEFLLKSQDKIHRKIDGIKIEEEECIQILKTERDLTSKEY